MTWSETHRYYDALSEIEADLDRTGDGLLPWRAEYAAIFGDPAGLLLALRHRWDVLVQAQVEQPRDPSGRFSKELLTLAALHPGLMAALARDAETRATERRPVERAISEARGWTVPACTAGAEREPARLGPAA